MATGPDLSSPAAAAAAEAPLSSSAAATAVKKDRHIVSWSAEEDDVLRAQIALHGTDKYEFSLLPVSIDCFLDLITVVYTNFPFGSWTIIAAQFKDKTARQCRRRWYNYLNSECKKGGWSREEDLLLCEAQKVLGNKWTEIAKVVSGRTDNAVKNRFSTLCKRRAKDDELFKENGSLCSSVNAKRALTQTECVASDAAGSAPPIKQMRPCNSDFKENMTPNMRSLGEGKNTQDSRQPLAIVYQNNQDNVNTMDTQNLAKTAAKQSCGEEQNCVKHEGNFLNKDDPKIATLLQRADLLCSLATKINTENTSMDEAWQQLQHHLDKKDDIDVSESSTSEMASLLEDLDDLIVDPYENEEEDDQKLKDQTEQIDVQNTENPSQTSMEVTSQMAPNNEMEDCPNDKSTEDNNMESCPAKAGGGIPTPENLTDAAIEDCLLHCVEYSSPVHIVIQAITDAEIAASENLSEVLEHNRLQCTKSAPFAHTTTQAKTDAETPASEKLSEVVKCSKPPCTEFTSPAHTVPTFLPYADDMPTPKFTASERNFLLSVLELTSPGSRPDTSQQPSCKRALLNSL
uniref:Uncharacterized protein n=1 Tax=Leersia perrieri TaxID=77586 RepID=A0A0D9X1Q2_9ORYZ